MAENPEIVVLNGPLAGKRFAVPPAGLRVGRSSSNDIHADDIEMSRNHCIFERDGDSGAAVIDLASANGTFVNGESIGSVRRILSAGDTVEAGQMRFRLAPRSAGADGVVDLGLDGAEGTRAGASAAPGPARGGGRSRGGLVCLAALLAAAIAACVWIVAYESVPAPEAPAGDGGGDDLVSLEYEKVEADSSHIFRYVMTVDQEGGISVVCDDVPDARRHVEKSARPGRPALARISAILDECGWGGLEESYSGAPPESANALRSWCIRAVRERSGAKEVTVSNIVEPEPFRAIRTALEAYSRNELGIWAVQHTAENLIEMSEESARVGDRKWDERDVEYGNLSEAADAYAEAIYCLETVEPKPTSYDELRKRLARAKEELDARYRERRFLADKALNLADWETARSELKILCEMIPKRNDPRNAEASAKLVDVEKRCAERGKGAR